MYGLLTLEPMVPLLVGCVVEVAEEEVDEEEVVVLPLEDMLRLSSSRVQ